MFFGSGLIARRDVLESLVCCVTDDLIFAFNKKKLFSV